MLTEHSELSVLLANKQRLVKPDEIGSYRYPGIFQRISSQLLFEHPCAIYSSFGLKLRQNCENLNLWKYHLRRFTFMKEELPSKMSQCPMEITTFL